MKKITLLLLVAATIAAGEANSQQRIDRFARPLGSVLDQIAARFEVKLKIEVDTAGLLLDFADSRIRPYSVEETLTNVLAPFDYKFVKQNDTYYKIKPYEYNRRTFEDGEKLTAYLSTLYTDREQFEARAKVVRADFRSLVGIDSGLSKCVEGAVPAMGKIRKMDGYTVQNFRLETLPGYYVCGSIYAPAGRTKGSKALILNPNGHFFDGRCNRDIQMRMGVLARMGAIAVDWDLLGYGESALQVSYQGHQSAVSQLVQSVNAIKVLDMMLATFNDIDRQRIGCCGGSGGGTQTVQLAVLDDRLTAIAPVISLSAHFDGGCPCESGLFDTRAGGGTCNAELAALFAPRPMLIVSDGGDWTANVPVNEYPFIKQIYGFYGAQESVSNVHLPNEKHDFGVNKRMPVYDFFATVFALDRSKGDESKITIEPNAQLSAFDNGKLPEGAIESIEELEAMFIPAVERQMRSDEGLDKKAAEWIGKLELNDSQKEQRLTKVVATHLKEVRDWHNAHPVSTVPDGIEPNRGVKMNTIEREVIAASAKPDSIHRRLMEGLRSDLSEEQVEQVLDLYTVDKVEFTMNGYRSIVPDLTADDEAELYKLLKQAREQAVDYKSMKQISQIFDIYKTKCEMYFYQTNRNWKAMYKAYTDKRKAEKAAAQQK